MSENLHSELDSELYCPQCGATPYRIYRIQVHPGSDVYTHHIVAINGAPECSNPSKPSCPICEVELERFG